MTSLEKLQEIEQQGATELDAAQIAVLFAAIAEQKTELQPVDDPGWAGVGPGRQETVMLADVAQRILQKHAAQTLPVLSERYADLPAPARRRVRHILRDFSAEQWAALPSALRARVRTALGTNLASSAQREEDRAESRELLADLAWQDALLLALSQPDEPAQVAAAIALFLAGMNAGSEWQNHRAAELVAKLRGSAALATALSESLLAPRSPRVSSWYGLALRNLGQPLAAETVARLLAALAAPRSPEHEWAVLTALEPYAQDLARLPAAQTRPLVAVLARRCRDSRNDSLLRFAIGLAGAAPLFAALRAEYEDRLRSTSEATLRETLSRLTLFGAAAAPLLPTLCELLDASVSSAVRYELFRVLTALGPAAAPVIPALLRLLAREDSEGAVETLGAMGAAASVAIPILKKLHAAAARKPRFRALLTAALKQIGDSGNA